MITKPKIVLQSRKKRKRSQPRPLRWKKKRGQRGHLLGVDLRSEIDQKEEEDTAPRTTRMTKEFAQKRIGKGLMAVMEISNPVDINYHLPPRVLRAGESIVTPSAPLLSSTMHSSSCPCGHLIQLESRPDYYEHLM